MTAFSADSVESTTVVGYQLIEVPNIAYTLFAPTFKGLAGDIDLATIQIVDAEGTPIEDYSAITFQTMDENNAFDGQTCRTYTWMGFETAWEDEDGNQIGKETAFIKLGDAVLVANNFGDTVYLRVSGEVDFVNKTKIENIPFVLWGNASPIEIDLAKVTVVNEAGALIEDYSAVTLQTMDENNAFDGATCKTFTWIGYEIGWEDENGEMISKGTEMVAPGSAFLLANNFGDVVYMSVSSPITK